MALNSLQNIEKVIINTGNILSLNDITKKSAQNPSEELIEAINITIKEFYNGSTSNPQPDHLLVINRPNDDLLVKISEQEISNLKIGLKIFLNSDSQILVSEAIEKAFIILNVASIHDVIITFKQKQDDGLKDDISQIKTIWNTLEKYVETEQIKQIGIADVEESTFRDLYEWAAVKPSILQINLSTCCVVPPTLQVFCKEKDVKLLTHSDPSDILPKASIEYIFGKPLSLKWALRFLIHIRCRGVLTSKGYLLSLDSE